MSTALYRTQFDKFEFKTVSEREAPGRKFQMRILQMEFSSPQGVPKWRNGTGIGGQE